MTKTLTLDQLHKLNLSCVFCGKSSKNTDGGYFKEKFVCRECSDKFAVVESFLRNEPLKPNYDEVKK